MVKTLYSILHRSLDLTKNMYVLSILVLKNSIPEIIIGITNTIIIAAKILIFNPIADNTPKTNKLATKLRIRYFIKSPRRCTP